MPTITAGDLARRIQSLGGDPSKTFITDADCWDWIMDAQHQISKITECLTSTYAVSSVANQEMYTTPNTTLKYLRVTYDGKKLWPISIEMVDEIDPLRDSVATGGVPTHYFSDGGELGLWPKPASALTNGIRVRARILASSVIDAAGDVIQIPDYFSEDIVRYCMLKMREKDEQPETMQLLYSDWQAKLAISKDISNYAEGSSYPSVRDVESTFDYYPEWFTQ